MGPSVSATVLTAAVRARLVHLVFLFVAPFALALPAAAAFPSQNASVIHGTVADPSDRPVPGAVVVVRSAAGFVREARTNAAGAFEVVDLQPGAYDVIVTLDGFRADTTRVALKDGDRRAVTLALRLSAVTETMVVSASYVATPLSEAPAGTVALTHGDMEARQFATVADALSLAPGMAVAANGGAGAVTSVFARGGESDFTLVLVDGVKLNSFGGGFDFGHLTTAGLSSVEVVRGPQSAVFGADAIGGVVQVRSRVGGAPAMSVGVESGGYGTRRLLAGSSGSRGRLGWGAHVERLSSDGWTGVAVPGSVATIVNDQYEATTAVLGGAWHASPRTAIRADARFGTNERGYPGPFGSNPIGAFAGVDDVSRGTNRLALGSVSVTHELSPHAVVRAQGSWMSLESDFASPWGDSMSLTRRWSWRALIDRAIGGHVSVTAGVEADIERAESTYITGASGDRLPVTRNLLGYFGEARVRAGSRLFMTAGLRLEHITRAALQADPSAFTPRPALPADTVISPNPRVAISYFVRSSEQSRGNWTRLHASAGTGIRAPDAFEVASTDNPGLRPERSRSLDGGLEQSLFGGRLIVGGTLFSNEYDDLIVAVGRSFANASRYRTDNIANARARGAEVSAAVRLRNGLEVRGAYAFVDTDVLAVDGSGGAAPPPFSVGDPLIRRPRHQASLDVVFARGRWTSFARTVARGTVLDVEPNYGAFGGLFEAAGFTVLDAGAGLRLGRLAEVVARAGNLLDRRYERAFGFPAPRRTFTIGLRLAASR